MPPFQAIADVFRYERGSYEFKAERSLWHTPINVRLEADLS